MTTVKLAIVPSNVNGMIERKGMDRRIFVQGVCLSVLGLSGAVSANPSIARSPAAARIGQRIQASLPQETLTRILSELPFLPSEPGTALLTRVAADHRDGRIVKVLGVSLAMSEAAWCVAAARALEVS